MDRKSWRGWLAVGLVLTAGPIAIGQDAPTPTPAAVDRAHQLFQGTWEVVSFTENGETLGADLVRERLVLNGRIRFADRSMIVTTPRSGETRATPYRLNPAAQPRRIDLTNRNDQVQEGVYQFDGDELILNIAEQPGPNRPGDFTAAAGSNTMLVRLRMVPGTGLAKAKTPARAPEPQPEPEPALEPTTRVKPKPADNPPPAVAEALTGEPRKATAAELRTAHDLLTGDWTILSIVDDGETLGPALIRQSVAENGRVRFTANTVSVINPAEDRTRTLTFRVNPAASPSQIDATVFDSVQRGIYTFNGDILQICLAKHEDDPRPTDFRAEAGSSRRLFRLKLAPKPVAVAPPPPSEAEIVRQREDKIRRMIAGRWVLRDANGLLNLNFRADGTFSAQRTWSRQARGLFGSKTETSEGRWSFQNSWLSAQVTVTTDKKIAGTLFGVHIVSISPDQIVTTDAVGIGRTLVKTP